MRPNLGIQTFPDDCLDRSQFLHCRAHHACDGCGHNVIVSRSHGVSEIALSGRHKDPSLHECIGCYGICHLVVRKRHQLRFHTGDVALMNTNPIRHLVGRHFANELFGNLDAPHRQVDESKCGAPERPQALLFSLLQRAGSLLFTGCGSVCPLGFNCGDRSGRENGKKPANPLDPTGKCVVRFQPSQRLCSKAAKFQLRLPRLIDGSSTLKRGLAQLLGAMALLVATPALSDPCKAIPDRGPLPSYLSRGATFSGPVTYVGDGDSLCVEVGRGPSTWVEVRVADFIAPELNAPGGREAKAALERITRGKRAVCTAGHRSYDRIVANCRIGGVSIGELMRRQGISEGGNGR